MQEKINFIINDLNNYEITLKQLCALFEKVILYYSEKDIKKLEHLIEGFTIYFSMLYQLIQEAKKQGEKNE